MLFAGIIFAVSAVALMVESVVRIIRDPHNSGHGLFIVASLVVAWIALVLLSSSLHAGFLVLLVTYAPAAVGAIVLIAISLLLLTNGFMVIKKEGLRIATLVPTAFALILLIPFHGSYVIVFLLSSHINFINLGLTLILVTIPTGIILAQITSFSLYTLIYARIGNRRLRNGGRCSWCRVERRRTHPLTPVTC